MEPADYEIKVVGATGTPLRDFYYVLMRLPWAATLAAIALAYLTLNAIFATAFFLVGGVEHAHPDSWLDAFYFSVQTMGTIGYGTMAPSAAGANALVVVESVVSLIFTALATGLLFAKFSVPTARVLFTRQAAISKMNGVPTLAFRVGNMRNNRIVEALLRVVLTRTETTTEGKTFYRMVDLKLARARNMSLSRSWTVFHTIDEESPLFGETAETLAAKDAEIGLSITGIDDMWMQSVIATHRYLHTQIAWGMRHTDILSENGNVVTLDLRRFHDLEPAD